MKDYQEKRPDPDLLLKNIHKETRGKLTIFLGAAAGVGKTYTMLDAAHDRKREGVDVSIGWIETHGRRETAALVAGLEQIAAHTLPYRGKLLREMDIDAIIKRKPDLVLVDELAHTNVDGSRHLRRFQDVEELLQVGINVYTTLNIQHIESINDVVAQITGVIVRETVPDYILEQADSVQLIDIPPEELIKRLKEGKVYAPGQAEQALKQFFRPGNINALRELSLRFTASRVDREMHDYMRQHNIEGPWPAAERVMVCVSASPFSAQLIRAARRLAGGLQAELIALHVEDDNRRFPIGDKERDRVARNMRLAEELGAKTFTVLGKNFVEEVLGVARSQNVSAIVVGKPQHGRFKEFWQSSAVDKLIRGSGNIHVYVIQGTAEQEQVSAVKTTRRAEPVSWGQYAFCFFMVSLVSLFCSWLRDYMELVNIPLLYQLPVTLSAFWWGRWPAYFTALCGVAAFDFLFVPPFYTFTVADFRYLWSFVTFLIIAFVIGKRTEFLRTEATLAQQRERTARALYGFSKEIAAVIDLKAIARGLVKQASETVERAIVVLMPDGSGKLTAVAQYNPSDSGNYWRALDDPSEAAVAAWSFQHGTPAGRTTDTLPGANYLYMPLKTTDNIVGIMGVHLSEKALAPEEKRLIDAWTGLAALAIERVQLTQKAREAALLTEADRLRNALFNSISHELKTPLASIIGSVSVLLEPEGVYSASAKTELLENIRDGAVRMERIVNNLLDTARLESGMMKLKIDWCDMEDIIGTALQRIGEAAGRYKIDIRIEPDLPLLKGDCVLLEQVLLNLLDNAMKYSPAESTIMVTAQSYDKQIKVSVLDRGSGIPEEDLAKVFDKFYRVQQPRKVSGTGLGLSICKGIVDQHAGAIWAERRPGGGSMISFTVPAHADGKIPNGKAGENDV